MNKTILINKDGKQLGPYSIDDAKSLVLSGQVSATDWAWTDGATDWVPLNHIPGFSTPSQSHAPANVTVTAVPPASSLPVTAAHEQELWSGTPSQLLNVGLYVTWIFIFLCAAIAAAVASASGSVDEKAFPIGITALAFVVLVPFCILQCIFRILKIRSTRYVVTTQRVRIVRGIFSNDIQEIELFRVKDTSAHQTFVLRMFGLGNVRILSGDSSNPSLFLWAIPKSVQLRERIRQEVLVLRQKFGVRELDVM